jgi:hypothetical protein
MKRYSLYWCILQVSTILGPFILKKRLVISRDCPLGGFNVSNLMGITRRKIDIGKLITFYFLQNVSKCTVFSHLHLKYAKSAIMTQKIFFLKIIIMGIKKRRILCWFQIRWFKFCCLCKVNLLMKRYSLYWCILQVSTILVPFILKKRLVISRDCPASPFSFIKAKGYPQQNFCLSLSWGGGTFEELKAVLIRSFCNVCTSNRSTQQPQG